MSAGGSPTIQVACPKCGKHLKAPAAAAGKKARCPSCQSLMMLPVPGTAGAPAAYPNPAFPSAPLPNLPVPGAAAAGPQQPLAGSALSGGLSDLLDEAQPSGWNAGDGYAVAAPEPAPTSSAAVDTRFEAIKPVKAKKRRKSKSFSDNSSALAGLGLMILAVVWFVGGLFVGYIFFYPPILFLIGLVTFLKGLFTAVTGGD